TGGMIDVTDGPGPHADPAISEWMAACVGASDTAFPYGPTYVAQTCNDKNSGPKVSFPSCEGGYPGIFDMSANVGEWDYSCTDYNDPDVLQNCLVRGGSWYETGDDLRCDRFRDTTRFNQGDGIGIRCCSD